MIIEYECDHFKCYYNSDQGVLYVTYRSIMSPDITRQFYQWLGGMVAKNPEELMRSKGSIYDFRQVTNFDNRNLTTVQRESQQFNQQADASNHPVALIVQSKLQEQLVRVTMRVSPQQDRKRIVFSDKAALDFIESYHKDLKSHEKV
jgi:hypothetical protein